MEDVLDVYHRPPAPLRPVACLDETSRQVLADPRAPLAVGPGRPVRHDPEYARGGVVNLFLVTEPLRGWRQVRLGDQRTRIDFANRIKDLVDIHYPDAEHIVPALDRLNTHSPAALSAHCSPARAERPADRLEIHYTPKHGSWLNMAEVEPSALRRQCLHRRRGDRETMEREVAAWTAARTATATPIAWHFATAHARIKLQRLYPAF